MSLTAAYEGPWQLPGIDCQALFRTIEDVERDSNGAPILSDVDDPENPGTTIKIPRKIIRYQKRRHYTLSRRRKVVGVTAYSEDVDATATSFDLQLAPGQTLTYSSTGKNWVCTADRLQEIQFETGSFSQEQQWEFYSPWDDVDMSEFNQ